MILQIAMEDSYNLLCMACLCFGRKLREIKEEKFRQYYLDAVNEIPLCTKSIEYPHLCWECEALLRKSVNFREQAKDSYRILQTYTAENLTECLLSEVTRNPQLKIHSAESVDIPSQSENKPEIQVMCFKEEVKYEWDNIQQNMLDETTELASESNNTEVGSDNDQKMETAIQEIVKSSKKSKKKKKGKVEKHKKTKRMEKKNDKDVHKKVIKVDLSYEEMQLEREKESKRDSYMKAEYKCEMCLIIFTYSNSYKAHMKSKHSPDLGEYHCPICKTVMATVESFTSHYKRHMRRFECTLCHKRTVDMRVMDRHMRTAHEIVVNSYTCRQCGFESQSMDSHRYHQESHRARLPCARCDKTFRHRAGLMTHRITVHEFKNVFPCSKCDKVFKWKASLKRHLKVHDTKNYSSSRGVAYCATCEITFASICSYRRHLQNSLKHVSQNELKFICDHCQRHFADKTKLRDHIELKHLHRTYQCYICQRMSKSRVALDQHIRNVHVGRPHNKICHHCGKGFATKIELESHIRTHTGERPFICEYCPTTFTQQSNLYKHNRQVHLKIKSKRYPLNKKREEDKQTESVAGHNDPPGGNYPAAVGQFSSEGGFVM